MEISLALGGGGVRGVAHIGVIQTLENHGFSIKAIAGTSAGGLIGAVYAAGFTTKKLEAVANDLDKNRTYERHSDDNPSLLGLSFIEDKLTNLISDCTFDELEIPLAVTAACIETGQEIILRKGKVVRAVLATIAIPGIFPAQKIGGRLLTDGGILDPVPIQVARWMRPDLPVVAVGLHMVPQGYVMQEADFPIPVPGPSQIIEHLANLRPVQAFKIFHRSIEISSRHLAELNIKLYQPEVLIQPHVGHIGLLQNINIDEIIKEGILATEGELNLIEAETHWRRKIRRHVRRYVHPNPFPDYWGNVEE